MIRTRAMWGVVLGIGMTSCGLVEDMGAMLERQQAVESAVEKAVGASAQIGWKIHNGALSHVDVRFAAGDVSDKTLGELAGVIRPIVAREFEGRPEVLVISATITADE